MKDVKCFNCERMMLCTSADIICTFLTGLSVQVVCLTIQSESLWVGSPIRAAVTA